MRTAHVLAELASRVYDVTSADAGVEGTAEVPLWGGAGRRVVLLTQLLHVRWGGQQCRFGAGAAAGQAGLVLLGRTVVSGCS